mgnify:CR=1 FL=1
MGCDAWIIRRLIPLQDCLVTTPTAKKLLRVQGRRFVCVHTFAVFTDQNGVIKTSTAIPEQHQSMASVPPEKSKFGIGTRPGGDEQRAPRKAAGGEETQLRIHLMEGLNDPLHRVALTLAIESIRPEQQLQLHDGTIDREGELRWLPTSQLQIPIKRVEAALPNAAVEQQMIPLA